MPLKSCYINGNKGWKWGDDGKCYATKEEAEKQGRAIEASKKKKKKTTKKEK